jgi:hypothetical protein
VITERTRVCLCHHIITDPATAECDRCGRAIVPHHSTWPLFFKWWLISELARRRFLPWLSEQAVFEWLLRDAMVPGGAHANPRGTHLTNESPVADLYPRALQLATDWKAAHSPIAQAVDLRRSA